MSQYYSRHCEVCHIFEIARYLKLPPFDSKVIEHILLNKLFFKNNTQLHDNQRSFAFTICHELIMYFDNNRRHADWQKFIDILIVGAETMSTCPVTSLDPNEKIKLNCSLAFTGATSEDVKTVGYNIWMDSFEDILTGDLSERPFFPFITKDTEYITPVAIEFFFPDFKLSVTFGTIAIFYEN